MILGSYHKAHIMKMCKDQGISHDKAHAITTQLAIGYTCVRRTLFNREIYHDAQLAIDKLKSETPNHLPTLIDKARDAGKREIEGNI